jgi:hypothetical protein
MPTIFLTVSGDAATRVSLGRLSFKTAIFIEYVPVLGGLGYSSGTPFELIRVFTKRDFAV